MTKVSLFSSVRTDLPAGIVVFLVALPLCLGISLASGAPFFSGIISGIIGGVVIGYFSGSNLSVSGPAAGLAALVLAAIHNIGDFQLFLCAVVIAGLLQILMGIGRLAAISNYFPSSVIKGMLTSIGILIIAKQIPHAVGYNENKKSDFSEFILVNESDYLFDDFLHMNLGVTLVCLLSIAIILICDRPGIKSKLKGVPGALIAVVAAIGLNELFRALGSPLAIDQTHLVTIDEAQSAQEFISFFTMPNLEGFLNSEVIITGIMIGLIATLETLLSIEAIDNIDPDRNLTNNDRELIAQGVGNTISGLIGGLPITSVIVRSSANVNAGAKSRLSTMFHGFLLLVCVISIPSLLNKIPLSALAAILLLTGYKLCKLSVFKQMIKNGLYQYIPFFVTVGVILGIDLFGLAPSLRGEGLLIGVIAGLLTASVGILHGNLKNAYYFHEDRHKVGDEIIIKLAQEVSFLNRASIRETLDHLPIESKVVIDASDTYYIDFDVLELIKEFRDIKVPLKRINLSLVGFKEDYNIHDHYSISSKH